MRRAVLLAAVLALTSCSVSTTDRPVTAPTVSEDPSPSLESPPVPSPDPLEALPTGPPPRIAYAEEGTIVHPDGSREVLAGQRRVGITEFTRFRNGWIVADGRIFEGTVGLAYVEGRRRTDLGPCTAGGAQLSGDGRLASWLSQGCPESNLVAPTIVHVAEAHGRDEELREIERVGLIGVRGFIGDEVVVSGYDNRVDLVGPGGATRPLGRLSWASDTCDRLGLVAGILRAGPRFGAVVDAETGATTWRRRHTQPELFSTDCSVVLGHVGRRPALLDGGTGRTVALVRASRLGLNGWAWEDDEHLLGVAQRGVRSAMVRVDLRGNVTRIGPIVSAVRWGYVFETLP